jgi:hypothetical protein
MSRPKQLAPTRFFAETLQAPVKNVRNSWGSFRKSHNQVFFRVWADQLIRAGDEERIRVLDPSRRKHRPGYSERVSHLREIENGAKAYGVLCVATDPGTTGARRIDSYDDVLLLELGRFVEVGGLIYGVIGRRIPIHEVVRSAGSAGDLARDLSEIISSSIDSTTKQTLIDARIGQGRFRMM